MCRISTLILTIRMRVSLLLVGLLSKQHPRDSQSGMQDGLASWIWAGLGVKLDSLAPSVAAGLQAALSAAAAAACHVSQTELLQAPFPSAYPTGGPCIRTPLH